MIELRAERAIAAPPESVFDWLADPANLTVAPALLTAHWRKDSLPRGVGAVREVLGAGVWLRERITGYDPPWSYSYLVVRSFPPARHEGGTITLTRTEHGTHVDWVSVVTIPALGGGKVAEALAGPLFRSSFRAILDGCAKVLEK